MTEVLQSTCEFCKQFRGHVSGQPAILCAFNSPLYSGVKREREFDPKRGDYYINCPKEKGLD